MQKKRKLLFLLLVALLALPLIANGSKEESSPDGPVEIDWFVNLGWYNSQWDVEKPIKKIFTERTGVTVNFLSSAGQEERLNIMIASGDLTDVITMRNTDLQVPQMEGAGLLAPLNKVIPEFSEEFWNRVPKSLVDWYEYEDGNFYGYPSAAWPEESWTEDNYLPTNGGMVARKDIMDALDITVDDFKTKEGTLTALRKVKDAGYTYDGLNVAPWWMTPNGGFPGDWAWVDTFAVRMESEDGDLLDYRTQPRYLEHLLFMNQMFREGLLSSDNFTTDRNQTTEMIMSGRVFAMVANSGDYRWQYRDLYNLDNEAMYVPVGPIKSEKGPEALYRGQASTGWLLSSINKDSEKIDDVLRLWEFFTSEEGRYLVHYGIEGDTYTIGEDGRTVYTEKWLSLEADPNKNPSVDYGKDGMYFFSDNAWSQLRDPLPTDEGTLVQQRVWNYFGAYSNANHLPFRNIGPAGGTDEAAINAQINTYWKEQLPQIVLAPTETEAIAIYNRSVERIKELGLDKVTAAQNIKFQEHKNRLGLDLAWPPNIK